MQVERELIDLVLKKVGIEKGDVVLLHSDTTAIMDITELKWANALDLLKDSFINVLGASGTLIVPTFNWDFCQGKTYYHNKTPSQVGVFTNNMLYDKRSIRSFHPIYSFAGIGPAAKYLFSDISKSSFGKNSVFHKLHQIDAKIVLFCMDPDILERDFTTTFIHYVEQMKCVDYRYIKYFKGKVNIGEKEYEDIFDFFVRFDDNPVEIDEKKIINHLLSTRKLKRVLIKNKYPVCQIGSKDLFDELIQMLDNNPYSLLKSPPRLIKVN